MYSLGFLLTLLLLLLTLFSASARHWEYLKAAYPLWSVDSWCVSFFWVSAFAATRCSGFVWRGVKTFTTFQLQKFNNCYWQREVKSETCFGSKGAYVQWVVVYNCLLLNNLLMRQRLSGNNVSQGLLLDDIRGVSCFSLLPCSSMMCQLSVVESKSATFPTERPRHLLDDSVLECHSPARGHTPSARLANGLSIGIVCVGGNTPAPVPGRCRLTDIWK